MRNGSELAGVWWGHMISSTDEEGQPWRLAFWPSGCVFGVSHPSDKSKNVARVGHPGSIVIRTRGAGSLNANARRFGAGTLQLLKVKIARKGGDGCDGGHRALSAHRTHLCASSERLEKSFLTYSYIGMYCLFMARAATTSDAFNAIAEPRRRQILVFLAGGEKQVMEIVVGLGMEQPAVSKHLRVLRETGLVRMRRNGRHKLYQTEAEAIRPLHEWSAFFEQYWSNQLLRVKERAEQMAASGADRS